MYDDQEMIKLREFIPHIGLLPEAIPSKLFLDTPALAISSELSRC